MTTAITAYAAATPKAPFERTVVQRRDPGPRDVVIKIAYAGICHSDIHTARGEWGEAIFPLVPGHEISGVVESVGAEVTRHRVGDRVGVGCLVDSCRECEPCRAGLEQFCLDGAVQTYNYVGKDGLPTYGGYSTHIIVDQDFVLSVPDGIDLAQAAPLMCAGITLFSPLNRFGAGPGTRVAIVGMGGLGHMGVKIAHKMGAEVTVLSQSLSKQDDGLRFGADHYYATGEQATFDALAGHFDLIVNTVSANLPITDYLELLRLNGVLVNVGAPPEPLGVVAHALLNNQRTWAGSLIGGLPETQRMLDFCAAHGIGADIEVIGADQIDAAYDRVVASDVRYRFVIDAATI